jgi:hypothetical protein
MNLSNIPDIPTPSSHLPIVGGYAAPVAAAGQSDETAARQESVNG